MLTVTLHSLERYAERVMELEEGMYLTKKQRGAINDRILNDLEAYHNFTGSMTVNLNGAKYVIKNQTVITVNPPDSAHITKYGGVTRGSKKKYKKMKKESICH